ncbi:MAG: poly-beta-1,6-N-acetyl-D-glucosamine N-deacetylase PgaB [Pseudomonadales bacterium]
MLLLLASVALPAERPELLALCYHDVVPTTLAAQADPNAVTVDSLVQQFAWLRERGYQPVSLDAWRGDPARLPAKPVLLTFDDGYASFYERVLPLLQLFGYPAVLAPVTRWIDTPEGATVDYGGEPAPRERFLTWAQIREIAGSGLVEIASHSHDLHRGLPANPQGNQQPAAVTHVYDRAGDRYESDADLTQRVHDDLARSIELIAQHTGTRPRTVAWPYGRYTAATVAAARSLGLDTALTLDRASNPVGSRTIHRLLLGSDMTLFDFAMAVQHLYPRAPLRAAQVDLDYLYDADPAQTERNLGALLDRIKAMGLNAVFLQAFADPDGDGVAGALYFRNRHLPMRADLFNRAAWQLRTRAGVAVFAWMPVLAFALPDPERNAALAVRASDGSERERHHRLSPFDPEARRIVREIYQDLGRAGAFDGVLFHDDAYLSDGEDRSAAALAYYRDVWQVDADAPSLARRKSLLLSDLTGVLADELRAYQPALKTARNLYARVLMEPDSEAWFAQNFADFLQRYDYTAVMAMPYLEQAGNAERWLRRLVARVQLYPGAIDRTLFQVQTVDWRRGMPIPAATLGHQLELLMASGARNIGYYPDDFASGRPSVQLVRSHLSVNSYPALAE